MRCRNLSNFSKKFLLCSILIYLIYLITALITNRSLYADGAHFFVQLLNNPISIADDSKHIRLFVNGFNQFPLLLLQHLGVNNIPILRWAFSFPLFFDNLLGLMTCLWLSVRSGKRWVFIFPLASYVLFFIISEVFIINQAFMAAWLYYIIFLYSLLNLEIKKYDWVITGLALSLAVRSHEAIIVYGSIIIGVILYQSFVCDRKNMYFKWTLMFIVLLEVIFAIWWQHSHPVSKQTNDYLKQLTLFIMYPELVFKSNFFLTIIGFVLLILSLFWGDKINLKDAGVFLKIKISLLTICGALILGVIIIHHYGTFPWVEFAERVWITFGGAGLMVLCFLVDVFKLDKRINVELCILILSIFLIAQSIWQIENNFRWNELAVKMKYAINTSQNAILKRNEYNLTDDRVLSNRFQWGWSDPVLSIALNDTYEIKALFEPYESREYFNVDINKKKITVPFQTISDTVFYTDTFFEKIKSQNKLKH